MKQEGRSARKTETMETPQPPPCCSTPSLQCTRPGNLGQPVTRPQQQTPMLKGWWFGHWIQNKVPGSCPGARSLRQQRLLSELVKCACKCCGCGGRMSHARSHWKCPNCASANVIIIFLWTDSINAIHPVIRGPKLCRRVWVRSD
ncbi:hypothetical protein GWK47_033448 [Chionoecetes opilio]|uniref:Uncharacterized protein n=1 Tax=Chionoecetes opilio TaxID=41210 RepID=A0A8J4YJR2_CHIOP|nr:hypothetical protein GWK47_033448 [Chionoecetes opilio]